MRMAHDAADGQVVLFGGSIRGCCLPIPRMFGRTWFLGVGRDDP
jgi:hypothetical protein